jgi:cation diffusion facilitator family transporter
MKDLNIRSDRAIQVTYVSIAWGVILIILKFIGGFAGNSSALVADAVHSLSDLVSDAFLLVAFFIVRQPQDENHNYGHGKFETLSAVMVGLLLVGAGIGIAAENFGKLIDFYHGVSYRIPGIIALAGAVLSIAIKEFLFFYTLKAAKDLNSTALTANAWHHHSDAMTSVATLIGVGGAMLLGGKFWVLDPLAAFVISFFILWMGVGITREAVSDLMERSLGPDVHKRIIELCGQVEGLSNPHEIRTRRIGSDAAIELHVEVPAKLSVEDAHELVDRYEKLLADEFGESAFITIHMDPSK